MQLGMRIDRRLVGEQRVYRQLACVRSLASYRQQRASRIYSVSGSRVHGWHPPQHEGQLPPPHAVAAPEVLPATELETEQQQEGAAPHVPRDNAYVRRKSQERVRMARDLGLNKTAAPGSSSSSSSSNGWLELVDAAVAPTTISEEPATADQAEAVADVAAATEAVAAPAVLPKGWAAAAAPAVAAEDIAAAATAVDAGNGTTTYTFNTSSNSVCDNQPKIFDSAIGTEVDSEAAAAATTAAANAAAASAAAANVASVESSWLYEQERQPLQVPKVQVVRMELARSPDGAEPAHFYMPDPLCIPCMCVEAGQQQETLQQAYNRQLVAACWRQAGRVAAVDKDPEEEGFVLLDYEEEERQAAELHQQEIAAPDAAAPADAAVEVPVAADASLASSSSSTDGKAVAAAGTEAQQQLEVQLPQQEVTAEMATVEFCFRCITQPGERLWLVGDGESLGNWDAAKAAKMKWSEGHTWSVSLPFEQGAKVTYKAVLQLADKEPKHWRWQGGPNNMVEARSSKDNAPLKVKHEFK